MKQLFVFWQFNGDNRSFCNQHCPYCHTADTLILMSGFTWKPIHQIKTGDVVVGYKFSNHRWRTTLADVTSTFHRQANVVQMVTDKVTTYCTHDHKWLTTFHGKTSRAYKRTEDIKKENIRFISNPVLSPIIDSDYKEGWLNGVLRGDGCIRAYPNNPNNKTYFRLAVKDHEILERFQAYTNHDLVEYDFLSPRIRAIQSQKKAVFQYMQSLTKNFKSTISFAKGFLAGVFDAEGSYSQGLLRISNKDVQIISDIETSCKKLGFKTVIEPQLKGMHNGVHTIRINGGMIDHVRFFAVTTPSVQRKQKHLLGRTTHNPHYPTRAKIRHLKDYGLAEVYNITTKTGNYVANGLVSKNCYGKENKDFKHYWNGAVKKWEKAFERLNRDIYFVFSYGEAMGSHGFYECVDMIGKHPKWTLNIITNLSYSPEKLINSQLGKEKRVFVVACWHPLGVSDRHKGWENFKKNLLLLKDAEIPTHVMMVWYKPQIPLIPDYFDWFDSHNIRFGVRRYVNDAVKQPVLRKVLRRAFPRQFAGKIVLEDYTEAEKGFLYAYTDPKAIKYGLDMESTFGKFCYAGKDMMLVKHDGTVTLCACCYGENHELGNLFSPSFKLRTTSTRCPTNTCGGDFGMLVLPDLEFGALPKQMWNDTFISQVQDLPQKSPVPYQNREEMIKWLGLIKQQ